MLNKNLKHKSNLFEARHRSGLEPKQVSFLLSRKTNDELYRYEKGRCFPNLLTLLKLEIIYEIPPRLMFQELFEALKTEIYEKRKSHPKLFPDSPWFPTHGEKLEQEEFCFYSNILRHRIPNSTEREVIKKHAIALVNTLSDYQQGREPFLLSNDQS